MPDTIEGLIEAFPGISTELLELYLRAKPVWDAEEALAQRKRDEEDAGKPTAEPHEAGSAGRYSSHPSQPDGNPRAARPEPDKPEPPKRKANGQFAKGSAGNPRGRPRKLARGFTERQDRIDFFTVMDADVGIIQNGKRVTVTGNVALKHKMLQLAADGDVRVMAMIMAERQRHLRDGRPSRPIANAIKAMEDSAALKGIENLDIHTQNALHRLRKLSRS